MSARPQRLPAPLRPALVALALAALAANASASPVIGFRERFLGDSLSGWSSGSMLSNPGTGGVGGAGDGYLQIAVPGPLPGNLGAFSATAHYAGDWTAAGVTQVRLWLNDVNAQDSLEIHFCIGNGATGNFWECNSAFIPPHQSWAIFTVDLTTPSNFSFIGTGTGNFGSALQNVDRILVRHDKAPYVKNPDQVVGDFGLDEILLTDGLAGVEAPGRIAAGVPVRLAPPAPNPSRGAVTLRVEAADDQPVILQVVDLEGRVVRHAALAGAAGARAWVWDGSDDRGQVVPPGAYRVRAIGPAGGTSRPLVRVR